jgi:hypothetical protein
MYLLAHDVDLVEGAAAAAGAAGVGVRDLESRPLEPVDEVDLGALQHLGALAIDRHLDPVVILDEVFQLVDFGVEEHLVGETRASTGANTNAERNGIFFRSEQLTGFVDGWWGEGDQSDSFGSGQYIDVEGVEE